MIYDLNFYTPSFIFLFQLILPINGMTRIIRREESFFYQEFELVTLICGLTASFWKRKILRPPVIVGWLSDIFYLIVLIL